MGLFDKFLKKQETQTYNDNEILAVCSGEMIEPGKISDVVFGEEIMGQTIGFIPSDGEIVSPCNGVIETLFPTGHAFTVRMNDGTGLLVHVGIDTVTMSGKGFKTFVKTGDSVKAGQKIVKMDISAVKEAGLDPVTMLIITEPVLEREQYIDYGAVTKGQVINIRQ